MPALGSLKPDCQRCNSSTPFMEWQSTARRTRLRDAKTRRPQLGSFLFCAIVLQSAQDKLVNSKSMPTLTARRLLTPIGSIEYPAITVTPDGLIADISSDPSITSQDTLTPTFLDIHTPGCAHHDV